MGSMSIYSVHDKENGGNSLCTCANFLLTLASYDLKNLGLNLMTPKMLCVVTK